MAEGVLGGEEQKTQAGFNDPVSEDGTCYLRAGIAPWVVVQLSQD